MDNLRNFFLTTTTVVQAYIDAELAAEAMVLTLAHIDACSKCKLRNHVGAVGSEGKQMAPALEELESRPASVSLGEFDLSPESLQAYYIEHPEKSIEMHTVLLEKVRTHRDRFREAVVLGELALAYARINQLRKAIYYFERHLEIARELGNWQWEMEDCRNLGRAHLELGDNERAGAIYSEAVQSPAGEMIWHGTLNILFV